MSPRSRRPPPDPTPFGQPGVLECDILEDRLLCHQCGRWYRNLAQHARRTHDLTPDEYRESAGLNRTTRLLSPGMLARLSELNTPRIEALRADGKLRRWNEDPEKLAACKAVAIEAIRQGKRAEARRHGSESWTDEDRQERAEQTRRRNLSGELRASPAAISAGIKRHLAEHPEAVDRERLKAMTRLAAEAHKIPKDATCERCGARYQTRCTRARWCPECRPAVYRERQAAWVRAKRAESLGD